MKSTRDTVRYPPLILASASPRRAMLMRQMELEFDIIPGHAPEAEHEFLTPRELALLNAYRKARVIAKQHPDALVIGADTVVCLGVQVFGKPVDLADARRTLSELSGRTHQVITGVCLVHLRRHRERLFAARTRVAFKKLNAAVLEDYLRRINPLDKAGAYAIQEHGSLVVKSIQGSRSNVVGLPVEALERELQHFKLD